METLTIHPDLNASGVIKCIPPAVIVSGEHRDDLSVSQIEWLPAPDFGKATITLCSSGIVKSADFSGVDELPAVGTAVELSPDGSEAKFFGIVDELNLNIGAAALPQASIRHVLAKYFDVPAGGRWQWGEIAQWQDDIPLAFNSDSSTLMGGDALINGRSCSIFSATFDAELWTVAAAIRYVLSAYLPREVAIPSLEELGFLCERQTLPATDFAEHTAAGALKELLDFAGLEARAGGDATPGVMVYRRGEGREKIVSLQSPGHSFKAAASNVSSAKVKTSRKAGMKKIIALGDWKRYETVFELQPCWDVAQESSRYRDFIRHESDNWDQRANVFRKWALNEHGRYSNSPLNLSQFDFATLSGEDFFRKTARKFLPCVSTDSSGASRGVVVEVKIGDQSWRRWAGAVLISPDDCSIYFDDDRLPGEYFQKAVGGNVQVRVTAVVVSDQRIKSQKYGDSTAAPKIIKAKARSVKVLSGGSGSIDESSILSQIVASASDSSDCGAEATITLGWVDETFRIGDVIDGIEGRQLEWSSPGLCRPSVRSVCHQYDSNWRTILVVG